MISFDIITLVLDDKRFKKKAGKTARFSSRPTIIFFYIIIHPIMQVKFLRG
jgi:hypothetical protein